MFNEEIIAVSYHHQGKDAIQIEFYFKDKIIHNYGKNNMITLDSSEYDRFISKSGAFETYIKKDLIYVLRKDSQPIIYMTDYKIYYFDSKIGRIKNVMRNKKYEKRLYNKILKSNIEVLENL